MLDAEDLAEMPLSGALATLLHYIKALESRVAALESYPKPLPWRIGERQPYTPYFPPRVGDYPPFSPVWSSGQTHVATIEGLVLWNGE